MGRMGQREAGEVARVQEVLRFAEYEGCQSNWLAGHFGEQRSVPCGHCQWCRTHRGLDSPFHPQVRLDLSVIRAAIDARQMHPELQDEPRVLARFLCGVTSPRTTRARLTSHQLFGVCRAVHFQVVVNAIRQEGGSLFPEGF
jgi:ATP-dependent DNA helicase RecQ